MGNRKCLYCKALIMGRAHGNRKYCDETCYLLAKKKRNYFQYKGVSGLLKEIRKNEKILKKVFAQYGSAIIALDIVHTLGMNWTLYPGQLTDGDTVYTTAGEYAYVIFKDNTIKIIQNEGVHTA